MEGWFYNLEVIVGGTSVALKGLSGDTGVILFYFLFIYLFILFFSSPGEYITI